MTANVLIELFRYALKQMVKKMIRAKPPYTDSFPALPPTAHHLKVIRKALIYGNIAVVNYYLGQVMNN